MCGRAGRAVTFGHVCIGFKKTHRTVISESTSAYPHFQHKPRLFDTPTVFQRRPRKYTKLALRFQAKGKKKKSHRLFLCAVRAHGDPRNGGDHGAHGSSSGAQGRHATSNTRRSTGFESSCRRTMSRQRFRSHRGILNCVGFWMTVTSRSSSSELSSPTLAISVKKKKVSPSTSSRSNRSNAPLAEADVCFLADDVGI